MALIKLIDSDSFFDPNEQTVTVIDFNESKGLLKKAADSRIQEFASRITPRTDKVYVHILALGAGEFYGPNKNLDWFGEHALLDYHKTFETSPAHLFKNHVNKNPEIAIGKVIYSIYNERMHRVELIVEVDRVAGTEFVAELDRGNFPKTSMACRTPADTCSICGNIASTRQSYCTHLRNDLGKMYPDGRRVMALNTHPLTFFDISWVVRPADVTSSVLQKLASEEEPIIGSAEMAEMEKLSAEGINKQAEIKKLSEFIKEMDGDISSYSDLLEPMLAKVRDPDLAIIDILRNFKLPEVFSTMAHLGISPSISFLAELIARKLHGDDYEGVGNLVASVVSQLGIAHMGIPEEENNVSANPMFAIANALMPYVPKSSYLPEYVEKRATIMPSTGVGFIGNGPHIEPTAYEKFRSINLGTDEKTGLMKILHTIVALGGAALAAKWYITRLIEEKSKETSTTPSNTGVKILLVKSASDYRLTYKLAKAAMAKVLKK